MRIPCNKEKRKASTWADFPFSDIYVKEFTICHVDQAEAVADNLCRDPNGAADDVCHDSNDLEAEVVDDVCDDPNAAVVVYVCGDLVVRKVLPLLNRPLRLKNRFLLLVPRLSARS